MSLKIDNKLKSTLYLILVLFSSFILYELIFKIVEIEVQIQTRTMNNELLYKVELTQMNNFNFKVQVKFEKIKYQVIEGQKLIELKRINSFTFQILKNDSVQQGEVSISLKKPSKNLHKIVDLYFTIPKA